MSAMKFSLYRYYHPDGTAKDWAISDIQNGYYTKKWGKTGSRLQTQTVKASLPKDTWKQCDAKLKKGYRYEGDFLMDDNGTLSSLSALSPAPISPEEETEAPCIYWWIKIPHEVTDAALLFYREMVCAKAQKVIAAYPCGDWAIALNRRYQDLACVKSAAGTLEKEAGVGALLLLMAIKKAVVGGITVSLSHADQVAISHRVKLENQALAFFDADFQSIRGVAEELGLIDRRIDLASLKTQVEGLYF